MIYTVVQLNVTKRVPILFIIVHQCGATDDKIRNTRCRERLLIPMANQID